MPTKSPTPKKPARRQRRHGDLPAGYRWRAGRPRWEPSPTRRGQGWKGCDLKDAWGRWLAQGAAIERATAIAKGVEDWAAGLAAPAGLLHIAPKGADLAGAGPAALNPRSIGTLLEAYYAGDRFTHLAASTQKDYRNKLSRFLEILAASAEPKKITALKALDIDILLPPAFNEPGQFELEAAYDTLLEAVGVPMAAGVMACVSAWLAWCVKKKRIWPSNPAELVERKTPDGRIVVYDWVELVELVRVADARGLPSIADAIILAVDLSWSQQDILALTHGQVSKDFHVKHRRIKTGNAGNPRLLAIGQARVEAIYARWQGETVKPLHLVVCELPDVPKGQAWNADTFRHYFAEIRAEAAKKVPSLLTKQFRDTRDTAVTYAYEAGLDLPQICSRTLHAPERAQAVLTKHYGAIRQGVADAAADKLDQHFKKMGYTFAALAALPAAKGEADHG